MLVLSRKIDEVIVIGDNVVRITVTDIRDGRVKLGIVAPGFQVDREEVYLRKKEQGDERTNGDVGVG